MIEQPPMIAGPNLTKDGCLYAGALAWCNIKQQKNNEKNSNNNNEKDVTLIKIGSKKDHKMYPFYCNYDQNTWLPIEPCNHWKIPFKDDCPKFDNFACVNWVCFCVSVCVCVFSVFCRFLFLVLTFFLTLSYFFCITVIK